MEKCKEGDKVMDLNTIIPHYYEMKQELDELKKTVEGENADIKREMENRGITDFQIGELIAKYIVAKKESFNEAKLIDVLKKHDCTGVIKTREYVDMDALENALYHDAYTKEIIMDIDKCRETKETIQLRVTKKGGKKDG